MQEIRHVSHSHKSELAKILKRNDNWRKLFDIIPRNLEDIGRENGEFVPKYEVNMARDIEDEARRQGIPVAMVLFDEWGTSGQNRPTVDHLYRLLNQIPLYRASDYIAKNILNIPPPERPPKGPGHRIDISLPTPSYDSDAVGRMLDGQPTPGTSALELGSIPGDNQDIPRLNKSFKKMDVSPSTESQSTKITTVTETDEENGPETNGIEQKTSDQAQEGSSGSRVNEINPLDMFPNIPSEDINRASDWRSVHSAEIPQCFSITSGRDLDSAKPDNNAQNCIIDPLAREYSSVNSADPLKSIKNSYSSIDWSSNAGEIPRCIMEESTNSYVPDPPVEA